MAVTNRQNLKTGCGAQLRDTKPQLTLPYIYKLERLDLRDNQFSGPLPASIGELSSLQALNLR